MRTIKFRAWDKKTKQFFYFNLNDNHIRKNFFLFEWANMPKEEYTGLKDKNGKEIYEGDILQFSDKAEWYRNDLFLTSKEKQKEILEDNIKYPMERRKITIPEDYEWLLSDEIQIEWEIIGNIYENPNLLTK